ncbi:hypothetical protein ANCDUO_17811 [Ancylostoma duodenale]|uniref:Uncharacterized protein n=1 Tax=Ancylostoma duodenale TaxID=51022 RepID=A0A0C2CQM6_9BILA|nr:hypothetical protein ANCDUO_17811 [Ancylostoma duodenale]
MFRRYGRNETTKTLRPWLRSQVRVSRGALTPSAAIDVLERLDAPIERIEIRLIDENSTNTVLEQPPAVGSEHPGTGPANPQLNGAATENAIDTNVVGSADQYDVRYKKVYIKTNLSHTVLPAAFLLPFVLAASLTALFC